MLPDLNHLITRRTRSAGPGSPTAAVLARHDRRATLSEDRISPFLRDIHKALLDRVQLRAWTRVLSIECADGWAAEEVWRRLMRGQVYGVDISPDMIYAAKRMRGIDGKLEFRVWDGQVLPFDAGSFNVVLSTFGFHRYVDPAGVLREIWRVLRPGGCVYLLEPDRSSFYGLYGLVDHYFRITDPGHVRYYGVEQLKELLRTSGFERVRVIERRERLLHGGKLLATGVVIEAAKSVAGSGEASAR